MTNAFVLAPLLAFCLGSPGTSDPSTTTVISRPVGTWDGRETLVIQQDELVGRVGAACLVFKAKYEVRKDGTVHAVITKATCCLDGSEYGRLEKGDTFSFRFQVEDGKMTLTELQGRFLGEIKQKQILEGVYKKREEKRR